MTRTWRTGPRWHDLAAGGGRRSAGCAAGGRSAHPPGGGCVRAARPARLRPALRQGQRHDVLLRRVGLRAAAAPQYGRRLPRAAQRALLARAGDRLQDPLRDRGAGSLRAVPGRGAAASPDDRCARLRVGATPGGRCARLGRRDAAALPGGGLRGRPVALPDRLPVRPRGGPRRVSAARTRQVFRGRRRDDPPGRVARERLARDSDRSWSGRVPARAAGAARAALGGDRPARPVRHLVRRLRQERAQGEERDGRSVLHGRRGGGRGGRRRRARGRVGAGAGRRRRGRPRRAHRAAAGLVAQLRDGPHHRGGVLGAHRARAGEPERGH